MNSEVEARRSAADQRESGTRRRSARVLVAASFAIFLAFLPLWTAPFLRTPLFGVTAWISLMAPGILIGYALFSAMGLLFPGWPTLARIAAALGVYFLLGLGFLAFAMPLLGPLRFELLVFLLTWPTWPFWFLLCTSHLWCPFN